MRHSPGVHSGTLVIFIVIINDLPNSNLVSNVRMYADDTTFTYAARNQDELTQNIDSDLRNVYEWLNANKLSLNITKTKCTVCSLVRDIAFINYRKILKLTLMVVKYCRKSKFIQTSGRVCG